jgi:hypothetical protein
MPLFKHKGYKGGRADDPHGVTAATRTRSELLGATKSSKDPDTGRIRIDSEPLLTSEQASSMYSKKEQKKMDKGLKEINKPKNRAKSEARGAVYNRAKIDEEARLKSPIQSNRPFSNSAKGGVAEAYAKGGFEGVKKYDNEKFGGRQGNMGRSQASKQLFDDPAIRKDELNPYR